MHVSQSAKCATSTRIPRAVWVYTERESKIQTWWGISLALLLPYRKQPLFVIHYMEGWVDYRPETSNDIRRRSRNVNGQLSW